MNNKMANQRHETHIFQHRMCNCESLRMHIPKCVCFWLCTVNVDGGTGNASHSQATGSRNISDNYIICIIHSI